MRSTFCTLPNKLSSSINTEKLSLTTWKTECLWWPLTWPKWLASWSARDWSLMQAVWSIWPNSQPPQSKFWVIIKLATTYPKKQKYFFYTQIIWILWEILFWINFSLFWQYLGAEKALFKAIKTKKNTPKYGLLYQASIVGQASNKLKGKVSRALAGKCSLCIRCDALGTFVAI